MTDLKKEREYPSALGLIDPARLEHIPKEFHAQHEFCFRLHDMLADVIRQAERHRVAEVKVRFKDEAEARAFSNFKGDPISFFLEHGKADVAKRITMNQVVVPLYADALHFIYEGLSSLERRKYAVAFTLLRKPLKYDLMFATWIVADETDFFDRMNKSPADWLDDKSLSKHRRIELLRQAIRTIENSEFLDAGVIYNMVYNKAFKNGLAIYFDKAAHLVTSRGETMRTERLNLNFIFKNPNDTDVYEGVYYPLAYLLSYLLLLGITTVGRMSSVAESYKQWLSVVVLGAFEAIFGDGSIHLADQMNAVFDGFLHCSICGAKLTVTKENAPRFFLAELINCERCNIEQQFPLFWLMTVMWKFGKKGEHGATR